MFSFICLLWLCRSSRKQTDSQQLLALTKCFGFNHARTSAQKSAHVQLHFRNDSVNDTRAKWQKERWLRIVCSFAYSTHLYAILFCRLGIEFSLWRNTNQIDSNALRFVQKKVNEIDSVRMKSCMKALHTCASTWGGVGHVCVCAARCLASCYTNQLLMDAIVVIWSITSLCIRISTLVRARKILPHCVFELLRNMDIDKFGGSNLISGNPRASELTHSLPLMNSKIQLTCFPSNLRTAEGLRATRII